MNISTPSDPEATDLPGRLAGGDADDGIDLSLIRWILSLTPAERLLALQQAAESILRLRGDRSGS